MVRTLLPLACLGVLGLAGCSRDAGDAPAPSNPVPDAAAAPRVETVAPHAEAAAADAASPDDAPADASGLDSHDSIAPGAERPPAFPGQADDVTYTCEDGSRVRITYNGSYANVTLPNGGIAPLQHSPAASATGGAAYIGDALALRRVDTHVLLEQEGRPARRCSEPVPLSCVPHGDASWPA